MTECQEKWILIKKDKLNMVDGRISENNRRKERAVEYDINYQGEWGTVRTSKTGSVIKKRMGS